ncbi:unnamed protein product [Cyprideis torosa]|uniref:Uncharacterized protein n=1 Tax=Cyprideis torosa TaxID=163714 RepID=A0A7R8WCG7_9CRUS|nr:unnamed protein product [Cyprideis torosa]CAG0892031.1 unnamed protein product [Cyprideis torosa]
MEAERQALLSSLLESVKQCQIRFGGRKELATEDDDRVLSLCRGFEKIFLHRLREQPFHSTRKKAPSSGSSGGSNSIVRNALEKRLVPASNSGVVDKKGFWSVVREVLSRHEYERYLLLHHVNTDLGRARAWLRAAFNENALERYLHILLSDEDRLRGFYEDGAFMLDSERSSVLPNMAAGLGSILFAISIDRESLNQASLMESFPCTIDPEPVIPYKISSSPPNSYQVRRHSASSSDHSPSVKGSPHHPSSSRPHHPRRRRPAPTQIISFDEDDAVGHAELVLPEGLLPRRTHSATDVTPVPLPTPLPPEERVASPPLPSSSSRFPPPSAPTLTPMSEPSIGELIPVDVETEATLPAQSEDDEGSESEVFSVPPADGSDEVSGLPLVEGEEGQQGRITAPGGCLSQSSDRTQGILDQSEKKFEDLRKAFISVLEEKSALDRTTERWLKGAVRSSQETEAALRAELEEALRREQLKATRTDQKFACLIRENELLKHQLKKYVNAVQLLRRDGTSAHETLAEIEQQQRAGGGVLTLSSSPSPSSSSNSEGGSGGSGSGGPRMSREHLFRDYYGEMEEYQRKLIQVAEMHGELMEFNERLQRLLRQREATICRLREELVDLRGPLPDEEGFEEEGEDVSDRLSVTSDYDASLAAGGRPLINIWIPSAFLTGGPSDAYHVYQIYIRIRDDEWNIYRRYAQFYSFHRSLKKQNALIATFDFPPKKALGNKTPHFVEERRKKLQSYLRQVVNFMITNCPDLSLMPDRETLTRVLPFFKVLAKKLSRYRLPQREHERSHLMTVMKEVRLKYEGNSERASSRRKALTDTRMIGLDGALKGNQDSSYKLIVRPRMTCGSPQMYVQHTPWYQWLASPPSLETSNEGMFRVCRRTHRELRPWGGRQGPEGA